MIESIEKEIEFCIVNDARRFLRVFTSEHELLTGRIGIVLYRITVSF